MRLLVSAAPRGAVLLAASRSYVLQSILVFALLFAVVAARMISIRSFSRTLRGWSNTRVAVTVFVIGTVMVGVALLGAQLS